MPDVYLRSGAASPNDVTLRDPTVADSGGTTDAVATSTDSVGVALAIGESVWQAVGNSNGTGAAQATGASVWQADASAAGTSTATAVGASLNDTIASAAGTSTAQAVGAAVFQAVASAAGTSEALASGASIWQAVANASGTSTADAVGEDAGGATTDAEGVAAGVGAALGVGAGGAARRAAKGRPRVYQLRVIMPDNRVLELQNVRDGDRIFYDALAEAVPEAIVGPAPEADTQPKRRKGKSISKSAIKRAANRTSKRTAFDWLAEPARQAVQGRIPELGPLRMVEAVEAARAAMMEQKAAKEAAALAATTERNRQIAKALICILAEL